MAKNSLTIAFEQLLKRYSLEAEITADTYADLPNYQPDFILEEVGEIGWPSLDDSIVQLGATYYLVNEASQHTVLDHNDGKILTTVGDPLSWASYSYRQSIVDPESPKGSTSKPEYQYVNTLGESIWEIARRLHFDAVELAEHNELTVPYTIEKNQLLHLPGPRQLSDRRPINYELFDMPKPMYVSHELGTQKIAFGNARKPTDLMPSGPHHAHQTNIEVVAIAHVPIGEEETYGFYLDAWALGNYRETGAVAHTVGFNHSHLSEGAVEKPEATIAPVVMERLMEAAEEALQNLDEIEAEPEPEVEDLDSWKTTYQDLPETTRYMLIENLVIHDLDDRHPDRYREKHDDRIFIKGTFEKDGTLYGRPPTSDTNYHWYGIPMDMLDKYDEVYNDKVELYEKVAARLPLSLPEKTFEVFARNITELRRLKVGYDKFRHKK